MRKLRNFLGGRLFPCALLALLCAAAFVAAAIFLPRALAPIAILERLFALFVALYEVNAKEPHECKLPKLLLIVLLPWAGSLLCILWRRKPLDYPAMPDCTPFGEGMTTSVAAVSKRLCGLQACRAESVEYFSVGREMYERLLPDLAAAKNYIWLEYYIVAQGAFFHAVEEILIRKATEGVDVRLLYDDFGCSLLLPRRFSKTMKAKGIHAYPTRKIKFPSRALNRRNHRKIAVIDGEIAYTGGINLADEYIGETLRFGHWKDTAVRVTGAPAAEFAKLFVCDANVPHEPPPESDNGTIPCAVIADGAEDSAIRAGVSAICAMIGKAEHTVWLFTPYLAPDTQVLSALKTAAAAGKDVRIMIPHVPDKKLTFRITKSYARELMLCGVKIKEYTAGFLHAKSLVADGKYGFVSSYNLDFRSLYLQGECGLFAESEELAHALERDFLAAWETGTELTKANFFERKVCAVLRLFAPLV